MFDKSSPRMNRSSRGCVPGSGPMPRTTPNGAAMWVSHDYTFGGQEVPCIDGQQVSGHHPENGKNKGNQGNVECSYPPRQTDRD